MKRSLSFLYRNGFMCKPCSIRSWKCRWVLLIKLIKQASAYEAYDRTRTRTPMHTSKILGRCKKKAHLVWLKKLQGVRKIARLKQQRFLSFTLYKTHRSYEKIMCIYLLFHWFSGENCIIFTFSLHKGRQTSTD